LTRIEVAAEPVFGVAQLGSLIYVICKNAITVFDAHTYERLDDVTGGQEGTLEYAGDIVACNVKKCLYAFDSYSYAIYRLTQNAKQAEEWMETAEHEYELKLSVMSGGRVLVLGDQPPRLDVYGADSQPAYTVFLPNHMRELQHAVESPTGNFIVCHGALTSPVQRVCEVTTDGTLIRSYGGRRGDEDGQLNSPTHLAVDTDGRVFVADRHNCRIVMLDSKLQLCRVISTGGEATGDNPLRLCYNAESKRLMVGLNNGRVDVFQIP